MFAMILFGKNLLMKKIQMNHNKIGKKLKRQQKNKRLRKLQKRKHERSMLRYTKICLNGRKRKSRK